MLYLHYNGRQHYVCMGWIRVWRLLVIQYSILSDDGSRITIEFPLNYHENHETRLFRVELYVLLSLYRGISYNDNKQDLQRLFV